MMMVKMSNMIMMRMRYKDRDKKRQKGQKNEDIKLKRKYLEENEENTRRAGRDNKM